MTADIMASNGVIHVLDQVIAPLDIIRFVQLYPDFEILQEVAIRAGLVPVLEESEGITLFIPTDAAFEALMMALGVTADELYTREDLLPVLMNHATSERLRAADLADGMMLTTLGSGSLTVGVSDGVVTVGGATITLADVLVTNGVIHVVDAVLVPETD